MKKVKYLNFDNVKTVFMRTMGMEGEDFCHTDILENAEKLLLLKINRSGSALDSEQKELCEYAAACCAVYECSFEACLKEQAVMSENGEVKLKRAGTELVAAAELMRKNAFEKLAAAGLIDADKIDEKNQNGAFAFMCV